MTLKNSEKSQEVTLKYYLQRNLVRYKWCTLLFSSHGLQNSSQPNQIQYFNWNSTKLPILSACICKKERHRERQRDTDRV